MPSYIGAIDQGTTSSRFIVFDGSGRIVSIAQKEHEQIYPKPGWVEHDPAEIWRRVEEVIQEAMEAKGLRPSDLSGIGITNQRETTVLWNKMTGKAIYNAIVWQDTRVADSVAEFSANGGQDRFRAKTGLPLATYFSGLKIRWILNNVAGARAAAEAGDLLFGNIDSFLIWNLTGRQRRHPRDRRDQCQSHPADEPEFSELGQRHSEGIRDSSAGAAKDCVERRSLWQGNSQPDQRRSDCRRSWRSAGGPVWPGMLQTRRSQEHLWHRLLHADEYRGEDCSLQARLADHSGLQDRQQSCRVRAGRQHCSNRRAGAVGPRQPGNHPE